MTPAEAAIHNRAISMALNAFPKGRGAIKALLVRQAVVVEHIGTTTKQDVVDVCADP